MLLPQPVLICDWLAKMMGTMVMGWPPTNSQASKKNILLGVVTVHVGVVEIPKMLVGCLLSRLCALANTFLWHEHKGRNLQVSALTEAPHLVRMGPLRCPQVK